MGGLVIWLQCACFVYLLSLSVGRQSVSVSATVTAVSERSVSAVVSVTAITGLLTAPLSATAETRKSGFGRSLMGTH